MKEPVLSVLKMDSAAVNPTMLKSVGRIMGSVLSALKRVIVMIQLDQIAKEMMEPALGVRIMINAKTNPMMQISVTRVLENVRYVLSIKTVIRKTQIGANYQDMKDVSTAKELMMKILVMCVKKVN